MEVSIRNNDRVQMVTVKVRYTIYTRTILKICPMEINQSDDCSTYATAEEKQNVGKDTYDKLLA